MLRRRLNYLLLCLLVIAMGLSWRALPMATWASKYGGDALWALMAFAGMGTLWPHGSTRRRALTALGFCWAVEFSQLYHAPWLDAFRATRPGHLILGSTFNAPDLLAYACGVAVGSLLESGWRRRCGPGPKARGGLKSAPAHGKPL